MEEGRSLGNGEWSTLLRGFSGRLPCRVVLGGTGTVTLDYTTPLESNE